MSLRHVGYSELKTIKAQKMQVEPLTFPELPKECGWRAGSKKEASPWTTTVRRSRADREEPSMVSLLKVLSVPHCLCWSSKYLFTKPLLSHLLVNHLPPL